MAERTVWKISVIIEATADDADSAVEAIARTLCPENDHSGECPLPWLTSTCLFEDLDEDERAMWQEMFDEDRRRAGEVDEPSA